MNARPTQRPARPSVPLARTLVALALAPLALLAGRSGAPAAAAAPTDSSAAEIVSLQGAGEVRSVKDRSWSTASIGMGLAPGTFVRTGDASRMAILFYDETQVRLGQNSQLQIKEVVEAGRAPATRLRLDAGRSWTRAKAPSGRMTMETPAAIAAIRGTDWVMEVAADGASTLTVLSGVVELSNEKGRVQVGDGEQAVAEVGKAPVKRVLVDARERVQWVTAYTVDPCVHLAPVVQGPLAPVHEALRRRDGATALELLGEAGNGEDAQLARAAALLYAGEHRPAVDLLEAHVDSGRASRADAHLVLADLAVAGGDLEAARTWLAKAETAFPGDARVPSLDARVALLADRPADSRELVGEALARDPGAVEPHLAAGELGRFDGNAEGAERAYAEAVRIRPGDPRGWFGRGSVRTERERVTRARRDLLQALELDPGGPGYRGELATLETFADRYGPAAEQFEAALEAAPDDYVALAGRGLLLLKRGRPEAALESLLRASVVEPRYARAHAWAAVAYYQLGRVDRALEELARASELDPKDPLPHQLAAIIHVDGFEPERAVAESREALRLMPYLKSLSQVANDQKGGANLGAALGFFGLEEWAHSYAQDSYTPYWAGSHLFLGDRYPDGFAKSSELAQGYLTDPTAFGAGNRFHALVPRPGTYLALDLSGSYTDAGDDETALRWQARPKATLNGLSSAAFPLAYFADATAAWFRPAGGDYRTEGDAQSVTAALGAEPAHGLGLFLLGSLDRGALDFTFGAQEFAADFDSRRVDAGAHYRIAPDWQLWVKAGADAAQGGYEDYPFYDADSGTGWEVDYDEDLRERDLLVRHTVSVAGHELTAGAEYGRLRSEYGIAWPFSGMEAALVDEFDDTSLEAYLSDRFRIGPGLLVQADLRFQRHEHSFHERLSATGLGLVDDREGGSDLDRFCPALGLAWRARDGLVLRLAAQRWMRPFTVNTLGPVATAGIVLDDRFVNAGGLLERVAARAEWELDPRTFLAVAADYKQVESWQSEQLITGAPSLDSITKLRNIQVQNLASETYLEGVPLFGGGRLWSASVAVNRILAPSWSMFARYVLSGTENTTDDFDGNAVPYIPQHLGVVGSTLILPIGLHLNATLAYQSERFADEENGQRLEPGWNGAVTLFEESASKRWALHAGAGNLLSDVWNRTYFMDARYRF